MNDKLNTHVRMDASVRFNKPAEYFHIYLFLSSEVHMHLICYRFLQHHYNKNALWRNVCCCQSIVMLAEIESRCISHFFHAIVEYLLRNAKSSFCNPTKHDLSLYFVMRQ